MKSHYGDKTRNLLGDGAGAGGGGVVQGRGIPAQKKITLKIMCGKLLRFFKEYFVI